MPRNYTYNEPEVLDYIRRIDKKFHLVMLVEYLPESLILLRRLMNWSMKGSHTITLICRLQNYNKFDAYRYKFPAKVKMEYCFKSIKV